jgi:hypothetical protein
MKIRKVFEPRRKWKLLKLKGKFPLEICKHMGFNNSGSFLNKKILATPLPANIFSK